MAEFICINLQKEVLMFEAAPELDLKKIDKKLYDDLHQRISLLTPIILNKSFNQNPINDDEWLQTHCDLATD